MVAMPTASRTIIFSELRERMSTVNLAEILLSKQESKPHAGNAKGTPIKAVLDRRKCSFLTGREFCGGLGTLGWHHVVQLA